MSGPTLNQEMVDNLLHNAMSMRSDLLKRFLDPRRDYDKECGYPLSSAIKTEDYRRMFERDPIAARVVECLPNECWKVQPTVYEEEDSETETEFEQAWDKLGQSLRGESLYQDEQGSPIWEALAKADRLCGIGSFGVIYLAFNDMKTAEDARRPAPNFEDESSIEGESQYYNDQEGGTTDSEEVKLLFMRVLDESQVTISQYEKNLTSPRYGQPITYQLSFNKVDETERGGIGLTTETFTVHWTRIIHIADNLTTSEIFGEPRMKGVFNRLIDLTKLYGGSAEMYWKGAFPGLALNIDPKMGGDVGIDADSIRESMWNYTNSLQRWFALAGVSATTLSPQVVDPTSQIQVHLEAICIRLGIPKRIFLGSERGELASSQDAGAWNSRLKFRQQMFITPKIITLFVDRLIKVGVLPSPQGYSVSWPDLEAMSPSEKSTVANSIASALSTYVTMNLADLIEPLDYLTRVVGFNEKEAKTILDNRSQTLEDRRQQEQEAADTQKLGELEGSIDESQPDTEAQSA